VTTNTTTVAISNIPPQNNTLSTLPNSNPIHLDELAQANLVRVISEHIGSDLEIKFKAEISHLSRLNKGSTNPLVISVLQNINSSPTPNTPVFTPTSVGSPQNTDNNNNNNNNNANNNTVNINVNTTVSITNNTNPVQKSSMWWNPSSTSTSQSGSPVVQQTTPIQINCKEKQKLDKSELVDSAPDKKRSKVEALSPAGSSMAQFGSASKMNENENSSGNQGEKLGEFESSVCFGCKISLPGPFEGVGMCCSCTLKKIEKNYESKLLEELTRVHESGWKIFSRLTHSQYTTYVYSPSTLFPLVAIFSTPPNAFPLAVPRFSFYYYKLSSDVSSLRKLREQFELNVEKQKAYFSIISISDIWSSVLKGHEK